LFVCEDVFKKRQENEQSLQRYTFSSLIVGPDEICLSQSTLDPEVNYLNARGQITPLRLNFSYEQTANDLIRFTLSQPDVRKTFKRYQEKDFCLKVLGKEEYLLDDVPLQRYKVN
jgi:hypothetical protein